MRKFLPVVILATLFGIAACTGTNQQGTPLGPVAALPAPKLPNWISEISPAKQAQTLAQVRIIFTKPVTTVGALEGDAPADVLSHIRISPNLKGKFVVLTPRMIGFIPEQALPVATRVQITLTAGLRDLSGDSLANDLAWTFETAPVTFTNLPSLTATGDDSSTPAPAGTNPALQITANAGVDPLSLSAHASLVSGTDAIPLNARLEAQPTPYPGSGAQEAFDPSLNTWVYDLTPQRALAKATTYQLVIDPGVAPVYGNMPSSKRFTGAIHTYDALAIVPTPIPSPGSSYGRFSNGDPVVAFNNPIDPKSLGNTIELTDAAGHDVTKREPGFAKVEAGNPNVVALDPFLLSPDSAYRVTIASGIADTFGQNLDGDRTIAIHTADFTPGFWAPSGTNIFPSDMRVALNLYATNVPGNHYRAIFMPAALPMLLGSGDPTDSLPNQNTWPLVAIPAPTANEQRVITVPLRRLVHGAAGAAVYGIAADLGGRNTQSFTGLVQLTNLGIFAQTFPAEIRILVQHLSDGSPVSGAQITLYRTGDNASTIPCAHGTTDVAGILDINAATQPAAGSELAVCYAGNYPADEAPGILAVARSGTDWSYQRVDSWDGIYQYNVDGTWSNGQPLSRGTIFTDRQMYQPGETASVTGIAYYVRAGTIVADRNASYAVRLEDPDGGTKSLGSVRTDAHGVFSLRVPFGANLPLGYYTVDAKGSSGNDVSGQLRVAEFKPPNFKLDVTLTAPEPQASNAPIVGIAGSTINVNARASYLFGAPLAGGTAKINVTRDIATLAPPGWDEYVFGRQWFWPDQQPEFDSDALETSAAFDPAGSLQRTIAVPTDLPFPMTYSVDVQASDISHLSVDNTETFTALAGDGTIGLASDLVGQAGQALNVEAIVTNLAGGALSGTKIHIELQKMTYASATQIVEGGEQPQNAVQYTTVDSTDIASGDRPVTVQLHPKDAGPYRIRANFSGAKSDASETDLQAFVTGAGEVNWSSHDTTTAQIKLDKKTYKIGDTATAVVTSPFAQSDVYFAIVKQSVMQTMLVHANTNGPTITFKVTPAMLPNCAVEALVVRRGPPLAQVKPGALDSLSRIGVAPLHVNLGDRYIQVNVQPKSAMLEPGARQSLAVQIKNANGKPTRGEVVVMVVNDAILQLTGYRPPDLVQTIFADQPISTRFSDNRQQVVLQTQLPFAEKGWGYGGGFLAGAGSTRVRMNFQPLAYYRVLTTDRNGEASVTFTLPDDLTTWRAMAVAIGDDDMHFGNADATFIATKPLLTNPLLPQFARPGDTIDAGLSALASNGNGSTSNTNGGTMQLTGLVSGLLAFANGAPLSNHDPSRIDTTAQVTNRITALRFPITVGNLFTQTTAQPAMTSYHATATIQFNSQLGPDTDAFRVTLPIESRAVTESVIEAGANSGLVSIPIDFSRGGRLQVTLANSVVPQFTVPTEQTLTEDSLPFADDASSRLIIASTLQRLAPRYHLKLDFDPHNEAATALAALLKLQRDDGGFATYKGANESDPFDSAYAAKALASARAIVSISPSVLANVKAYLSRTLADPMRYMWSKDTATRARVRFEMLTALDALGDRRNDFLSDIAAQKATFDPATQIRLAVYLLRTPGWQNQGNMLADALMQTVHRTGRYSAENSTYRWSWIGSTVDAQSAMLQLLLARHASGDELDGAVRELVAQQCNCGWPTLDDTASAMQALTAYAATEKLTPFTVIAGAGGKQLGAVTFGTTATSQTFTADASTITARQLNLSTNGAKNMLHYVVLYTYPVANNSPGQLAGLRVIREIHAVGNQNALATMDLAAITDPILLNAGNIYDIGVRIIADHPVDNVIIEDPLPAGLEAIDASFKTSSTAAIAQYDSWQIDDQEIYPDRVLGYASHLEPGIYEMHYLVQSVTPGEYRWPGAHVYLRNAPEQFGRTASAILKMN